MSHAPRNAGWHLASLRNILTLEILSLRNILTSQRIHTVKFSVSKTVACGRPEREREREKVRGEGWRENEGRK